MDIQKIFDQQQEIDERAWDTFTSEYERRSPPPAQDNRWQRIGLNIGLFSAMIVSSIFTVQAFLEVFNLAGINPVLSLVGSITGFLMIDVILFFLTHFVISLAYKSTALSGNLNPRIVLYTAIAIAAFTFVVSIASNLYFMFIGFGVMARGSAAIKNVGLIVGLLLGTAPPIQSIAIGTIVAMMPLQLIVERKDWELSRQRAWFSFRRKHGLDLAIESRLERLSVVSEPRPIGRTSGQGYNYTPNASDTVKMHLEANPQDIELSVRELASMLGVGKSTVADVKRDMQSNNGHQS
jgi:hypothetical protein